MNRARLTTRTCGRVVAMAAVTVLALTATGGTAAATTQSTPQSTPQTTDQATPRPTDQPTDQPEAADEVETTPLTIDLTSLSPAQIPRRGAITLTGVVTNASSDDWADVNLAPIISAEPITSRDELAIAAATAPDAAVGERLTDTNVSVGDLGPGDTARFTLRVPVASLSVEDAPGVYWIGVHALGTGADGRDLVADGRVRTFIPLVGRSAARRTATVSVVLPLRERARRASDGSLNAPARWARLTGPDGRLSRLADFGASSGGDGVSWLVDPAVLDALEDYGLGNPPLSLGPPSRAGEEDQDDNAGDEDGDEDGGDDQAGASSEGASPAPSPSATPERTGAPSRTQRDRANEVLQTFLGAARGSDLLTLGYADPDVAALTRRGPALAKRAAALAARRMTSRELTGRPAVAPPEGYFDPDLLDDVPQGSVLVLTDRGRLERPVLSTLPSGHELLLGDQRVAAGGPGPTAAEDPLALRQRILSESALEVSKAAEGTEAPRPVVVVVPADWDPGASWQQADFFGGLDSVPWLQLAPLPRNATTTFDGELSYSPAQQAEEIGERNVSATRTLARTSTVLGQLLANTNDVDARLTGAALQASSYSARPNRGLAADQVLALNAAARSTMGRVRVTGTEFVTLSGGSGSLTVTLVNDLEQPITVGLRARTDSPTVRIETPDPVDMQPGQRTTLRLQVSSSVGVHDVTLHPVTTDGTRTGTPLTFSLRTSEVGQLIWYIIIAGGALLAVMIVRRIVLRLRNHRWREREGVGP